MSALSYRERFHHLTLIRESMLEAADPARAIAANLTYQSGALKIQNRTLKIDNKGRLVVLAFGKASLPMILQTSAVLEDLQWTGLASIPENANPKAENHIEWIKGGHPLPTAGSLRVGEQAAQLVSDLTARDRLIVLISGGGSAMMELLQPGINLEDLQQMNSALLRSGAPIEKINTVRKSVSRLKAGGLARLAAPAPVLSLILSDVIGDPLSAIASGPTVLRRVSRVSARGVLDEYGLWKQIPPSITAILRQPEAAIKPAPRPLNIILANNRLLVEAAAQRARQLGFSVHIRSRQLRGEASLVGEKIGRALLQVKDRPTCLLYGGETTVTVRGSGQGGRNQELALSAALALEASQPHALMSFASDGIDGPTDAAGAIIDSKTIAVAHSWGLDPKAALENNDTYPLLKKIGGLIQVGATGTNLNDVVVALAYPT